MVKKLVICPFCDDGRAFTWQGLSLHVKAKHPDKLSELKDNKNLYMEKFACDELGNPVGEPPEPSPEPDPKPELTPKPENTPKEKLPKPQAPEVTPPQKPAEEGGFLDNLRRSVFGD